MDLIDRPQAIQEIEKFIGYLDEDMVDRIKIAIGRLPSAKIIRCKDCKYRGERCENQHIEEYVEELGLDGWFVPNGNFSCIYAERRE